MQTLIGAGAAIVAGLISGLLAAWWQGEQAAKIAREIRRSEREEAALLELDDVLADMIRSLKERLAKDPNELLMTVDFPKAKAAAQRVADGWSSRSDRISAGGVRRAIEAAKLPEAVAAFDGPTIEPRDHLRAQIATLAEALERVRGEIRQIV